MAIITGFIRKIRGSAGDFTFSKSQGRTIVSEKITSTTDRKTRGQQRTRTKFVNILHNYSGLKPLLRSAFENKAPGVSDYNMFVRLNMQQQPVYLTKQLVECGACVAAPYSISQGTLPAIVVTTDGTNDVTNIAVGSLTINEQTTVAQFANAVVENNVSYNHDDQITFCHVEQRINPSTGIPYCIFTSHKVVLDKTNKSSLLAQVPAEAFTIINGFIGHAKPSCDCAYAWVHSRFNERDVKVSSQTLLCHNSLLAQYTSENAYRAAANSYGGEKKVFLSPE